MQALLRIAVFAILFMASGCEGNSGTVENPLPPVLPSTRSASETKVEAAVDEEAPSHLSLTEANVSRLVAGVDHGPVSAGPVVAPSLEPPTGQGVQPLAPVSSSRLEAPMLSPGDILPRYRLYAPELTDISAAAQLPDKPYEYLILLYQPLESLEQFAAPPGQLPDGFEEDTFAGRVLADLKEVRASSNLPALLESTFVVAAFESPSFAGRTVHQDVVDNCEPAVVHYFSETMGLPEDNVRVASVFPGFAAGVRAFVAGMFPKPVVTDSGSVDEWEVHDGADKPFVCLARVGDNGVPTIIGIFEEVSWRSLGRNVLGMLYEGSGAPRWEVDSMSACELAEAQQVASLPTPPDLSHINLRGANYLAENPYGWAYEKCMMDEIPDDFACDETEAAIMAVAQREAAGLRLMKLNGMNAIAVGITASTSGLHTADISFPGDPWEDELISKKADGATATDCQLRSTIRLAKQLGLTVMLKLYVLPLGEETDMPGGSEVTMAAGCYSPLSEAAWSDPGDGTTYEQYVNDWWKQWFARYEVLIDYYGELAAEEEVEWLLLGTAMWSTVKQGYYEDLDDESTWKNGWADVLIPKAEMAFKQGSEARWITYANDLFSMPPGEGPCPGCDIAQSIQEVDFWHLLDAVSLNMGYCLVFPEATLKDGVKAAAEFAVLEQGKPLLISQFGAASVQNGCCPKKDPDGNVVGVDPGSHCGAEAEVPGNFEDQAKAIGVILEAIDGCSVDSGGPGIEGVFVETWGNVSNYNSFPPLVLPGDSEAYFEQFVPSTPDCSYAPLHGLPETLDPSDPEDPYNPAAPGAFAPQFHDFFSSEGGVFEPFTNYPYSLSVVGKSAQALLYRSFWGLDWAWAP